MMTIVNKTKRLICLDIYRIPALGSLKLASSQVTPSIKQQVKNLEHMSKVDVFEEPDMVDTTVKQESEPETETKTTRKKSTKKQEAE